MNLDSVRQNKRNCERMEGQRFNNIIQLLTLLSVLAGIALVIYELRETRRLTQAQIATERLGMITQDVAAVYGENLAAVRARACFSPENLSNEDRIILASFFMNRMNRAAGFKIDEDIADFSGYWQQQTKSAVIDVRSYPQGAAYLRAAGAWDREFKDYVNEVLDSDPPYTCKTLLQLMGHSE